MRAPDRPRVRAPCARMAISAQALPPQPRGAPVRTQLARAPLVAAPVVRIRRGPIQREILTPDVPSSSQPMAMAQTSAMEVLVGLRSLRADGLARHVGRVDVSFWWRHLRPRRPAAPERRRAHVAARFHPFRWTRAPPAVDRGAPIRKTSIAVRSRALLRVYLLCPARTSPRQTRPIPVPRRAPRARRPALARLRILNVP